MRLLTDFYFSVLSMAKRRQRFVNELEAEHQPFENLQIVSRHPGMKTTVLYNEASSGSGHTHGTTDPHILWFIASVT